MFDKKILEEVVNQINRFQSSERKEKAFNFLNEIVKKQTKIKSISEKIDLLEKEHKELVLKEDELAKSIFRDIKTLHSIKKEDEDEKRKFSDKKEKVKIPVIFVWD